MALEVADEVGMPLMCHIDHPPPSYEDVVEALRPGDILTHAFRPFPNTPCNAQGAIKPVVLEARKRGVIFDIGHGKGSFAFKTARAMLAGGFEPDTISSGHDYVKVPLPRHAACQRRQGLDRQCGYGAETS
jgi:dihydroorotase